jgi:hypothetical protein
MHARRTTSHRLVTLAAICVIVAAAAVPLQACPVCFQMEDGPVTRGVRAAVLVLVGVTTGVLAGFAMFIVRFVRRTR